MKIPNIVTGLDKEQMQAVFDLPEQLIQGKVYTTEGTYHFDNDAKPPKFASTWEWDNELNILEIVDQYGQVYQFPRERVVFATFMPVPKVSADD